MIFSPLQHGFVSGKSCVTRQLLEFLDNLTEALDHSDDVDIIYLDFSKAFDKLQHRRLMKKLWGYGIRGNVYKWIKEFWQTDPSKSSWMDIHPVLNQSHLECLKTHSLCHLYK